ncbi:hypothetical protein Bbelb_395970 [Branchiostoma belcheri]|nr:hypothetical protein Bbelb_395970 [Branchiostoma belcheri]
MEYRREKLRVKNLTAGSERGKVGNLSGQTIQKDGIATKRILPPDGKYLYPTEVEKTPQVRRGKFTPESWHGCEGTRDSGQNQPGRYGVQTGGHFELLCLTRRGCLHGGRRDKIDYPPA